MKHTIVIPGLPPKECSPNFRGHWAERYRAGETYKSLVYYLVRSAVGPKPRKPPDAVKVVVTFQVADNRKRDQDNLIARWKPGQDALAQVLGLDDSVMVVGYKPIQRGKVPQVILEVETK